MPSASGCSERNSRGTAMSARMRRVVLMTLLVLSGIEVGMCGTLELIVSDSGRNESWSDKLRIGDAFNVEGADGKPVGGIMAGTAPIQQLLIPMPSQTELEQMSQGQEANWVQRLSAVLKDRVHIATTNGATLFEIRLLQDTPRPSNANMPWEENAHTDRFGRMSYRAIGELMKDLREREQTCRVTAALADSGCGAFARAIDHWKPYADTFRRVDLVDARASLTETRSVLSALGGRRTRLFSTEGVLTPVMSVGRVEVAEQVIGAYRGATLYTLQQRQEDAHSATESVQWMSSLRGSDSFTIRLQQHIEGDKVNGNAVHGISAQDFRDPITGWDPLNLTSYRRDAEKLGIVGASSPPVLPSIVDGIRTTGFSIASTDSRAGIPGRDSTSRAGTSRISSEALERIQSIPIFSKRMEAYIDEWTRVHGPGPVVLMVRGVQHRLEEGEDYAQENFPNHRVIILPSYESLGVFGNKVDIQKFRIVEDGVRTLLDRAKLTRNLDLPKVWNQLGSRGCEVLVSAHESGAGHDANKNVPYIIDAKQAGQSVPLLVFTSTNIDRKKAAELANAAIDYRSVTDSGDIVGLWTRSPKEVAEMSFGSRVANTPVVNIVAGEIGKVLAPFAGYNLDQHAKLQSQLNSVFDSALPQSKSTQNGKTHTVHVTAGNVGDVIRNRVDQDEPITLRETTCFDKYNALLGARGGKVDYDPWRLKNPEGQTVIAAMEEHKTLLDFTNPIPKTASHMQEGLRAWERPRLGDMMDLRRYGASTSPGRVGMLPQPDVGGVMLSSSAKIEGNGSTLHSGNVSLVFQNSAGVVDFTKLQRFATALWCTYLSVEGPGISIDPASKSLKRRMDMHKVRYIGQVRNTELGMVMRETDYLMKRWAVGTHRPDVEGFYSPDEFAEKLQDKMVSNRPSRFWFVPEGLAFKRSSNMLLLASGRMTCQTEYLDADPRIGKNEANELFARWLTDNYDAVAAQYPIFRDLFEYAQLVSLCTYFRENRVPMLWFLLANRELVLTEKAIDEVDQLVKRSGYKWYVTIYGGVELQLDKALRSKDCYQEDPNLQEAENLLLANTFGRSGEGGPAVFTVDDTTYTVASENTLKLFNTSAQGDTIQTDLALADEYDEAPGQREGPDEEGWHLVTPRLELVRYYNPQLQTRAQFGNGWHLLVPFRLEAEGLSSLSHSQVLPRRMTVVNALSGIRETLILNRNESDQHAYAREDKGGLAESLIRGSDGVWVLKDVLGAQFVFDSEGDLRRMTLRPDRDVSFKVGSKSQSKRIPGYIVEYEYGIRSINGRDTKVVTAIKQGGHTARIDWQADHSTTRIAAIRVLQQGQIQPVEVLAYEYDSNGMLARVSTKGGRSIAVRYEDENKRVVAVRN